MAAELAERPTSVSCKFSDAVPIFFAAAKARSTTSIGDGDFGDSDVESDSSHMSASAGQGHDAGNTLNPHAALTMVYHELLPRHWELYDIPETLEVYSMMTYTKRALHSGMGVHHTKFVLIFGEKRFRIIVTSANLTTSKSTDSVWSQEFPVRPQRRNASTVPTSSTAVRTSAQPPIPGKTTKTEMDPSTRLEPPPYFPGDPRKSFGHTLSHYLTEVDRCLLYTSPSPRDMRRSRMPSSA